MSINTAFYQIAKNVTAGDLAKIIGAKITGIETAVAEKAIIKDIASFHSASASTLVYQTDPKLLVGLKLKEQSSLRMRPERPRWAQKTSV